jgi:hypothetical protein
MLLIPCNTGIFIANGKSLPRAQEGISYFIINETYSLFNIQSFVFVRNERFFEECYQAYMEGRAEKDPSEYWYEGEIGFFDFYIIPLAKKLKDCKVFGVSSDEYLNYAESNKRQWEDNGREVVQSFVARYSGKCGSNKNNEAETE